MNIDNQKPNNFKNLLSKIHNKSEDIMFFIIQKTPDKFIPQWLMHWLERYTARRLKELEQQTIKLTWEKINLQNTVNNIQKAKKEAPSDD